MAYEHLAAALSNISNDYLRIKQEDRINARERAERAADTAENREYLDKVRKEDRDFAKQQGDDSFKRQKDLLTYQVVQLPIEQQKAAAQQLGVDVSAADWQAQLRKKLQAIESEAILAKAQANLDALLAVEGSDKARQLAGIRNTAEAVDKLDENVNLYQAGAAAVSGYNAALAKLKEIDPNGDLQELITSEYKALADAIPPGANRAKVLMAQYGIKVPDTATPEEVVLALRSSSTAQMLVKNNLAISAPLAVRGNMDIVAANADVALKSALLKDLSERSKGQINFTAPANTQSWFVAGGGEKKYPNLLVAGNTPGYLAPQAEGSPPGTTPAKKGINLTGLAPGGPGAAAPGVTPPPSATPFPAPSSNSIELQPMFLGAPATDLNANTRRNDAVSNTARAVAQGVGNFFSPSNWKGDMDAAYLDVPAEVTVEDLQAQLRALGDPTSPRAAEIRSRLYQMTSPAAYLNSAASRQQIPLTPAPSPVAMTSTAPVSPYGAVPPFFMSGSSRF